MTEAQVKILVVDDEENVRKLFERILNTTGYNVDTAADGEEALYKVSLGEIDVVLLDVNMPGISGIEVLKRLKTGLTDYCVIMVTANVDINTAIETLKMGAHDYITKPFNQDDVTRKVQQAIEKWQSSIEEKKRYLKLSAGITEKTNQAQEQFTELISSLSREHKLIHELASRQAGGGKELLSKLPKELQEPISSVEEFRDALLRILRRA